MSKKTNKKTLPKKPNRRSANKYRAFDPSLNLKSRYEEIMDIASYAHTLPEKEKKWLAAFTEEYVNANLNHSGKKLHKTKALKKSVYDKNNARNRCVFTQNKAQGQLMSIDTVFKELKKREEKDEINVNYIKKPKLK